MLRQLVEKRQFVGAQLLDRLRQLADPARPQQLALVAQYGEARSQQHQLVAQQLHQAVGAAQAWRVEIQVAAQTFQGADLTQKLHLSLVEVGLAFVGTDRRRGVGRQQLQHLVDLGEVAMGHGLRARRQQADHADASHRQ